MCELRSLSVDSWANRIVQEIGPVKRRNIFEKQLEIYVASKEDITNNEIGYNNFS